MAGPFIRKTGNDYNGKSSLVYSDDSKLYKDPLPYQYSTIKSRQGQYWMVNSTSAPFGSHQLHRYPPVRAKAYDAFFTKCAEKAENMINVVEAKKSMSMIATRSVQLLKFAKACKSLRFNDARHALNLTQSKRKVDKAKDPAGLWMEYTFGWTPLIGDIGKSVEILQRDFPGQRIRVLKRIKFSENADGAGPPYGRDMDISFASGISGLLEVTNPNLFLANQLGYANPLAVAWDLVPFSFVVDWFLPVNKFLRSFSNEFGMNVRKPATSEGFDCTASGFHEGDPYKGYNTATSRVYTRHTRPLVAPALFDRLKVPEISPWLAATSTSLLIQQLAGFKTKNSGRPPISETPRRPASNQKGILYGFNGQYFVS